MERQLITLHDIFELYYENNKQYGTIITKMIVDYDMHTTNTNDLPKWFRSFEFTYFVQPIDDTVMSKINRYNNGIDWNNVPSKPIWEEFYKLVVESLASNYINSV